jgi:citrate lyase subunit alpha/citrate CoA-transferase
MKMVKNALGRMVPAEINGKKAVPFKGIGKHRPEGRKHGAPIVTAADYPPDGDKRVPSLKEALVRAGLSDGMTVSIICATATWSPTGSLMSPRNWG